MTSEELNDTVFPEITIMLDMLEAHPTIEADCILGAFVHIVRQRVICAWEASESLAETALTPS